VRLIAAAVVIAVTLTLTGSAEAYTVAGLGTASCGTWTAARRDRNAWGFEQWALGFLSGIGYAGAAQDDPLYGTDADGVWGWFDNYCRAHPVVTLSNAAKAFDQAHPH
jgi:hypothetical protein